MAVSVEGAAGAAAGDGPASPQPKRQKKEDGVAVVNIDELLNTLLGADKRPPSRQTVALELETIQSVCELALRTFREQDMLLELEAPLMLCGDIHGQFHDLLRVFNICGRPGIAGDSNYLFLGDYVDRGRRSVETVMLLFAYKIRFPENFFLLRGNHETPSISRIYGFYDEIKARYNVKLWKTFCDVFNWLPVCAVIDDRVITMHGGLSESMLEKGDVRRKVLDLKRPSDVPDSGFMCDLLWADPSPNSTWFGPNDRGVSVSFGARVVKDFLSKENMDLVVRAHQVVEDGYEFFADRSLVTIFTAPNYCGEFDNAAAVLKIDSALYCTFEMLKPDMPALAPLS